MPEIKNTFTSGKMNKDLDERLVPKNEYRNALNIDIANSEDSDVGSAQNSYGNLVKSNTTIVGAKCVGSVLYPNNSINSTSVIWFIAGTNVDAIVEYFPDQQIAIPILVDVHKVITAVNGSMDNDDDTFVIDSANGLINNIRIGMQAVTTLGVSPNYPLVKKINIATTQANNSSSTSNLSAITLASANGNIRVGQTVTSTNISNSVTVLTITGTALVLSGAPGGTIAVDEVLTFTSINTITVDSYQGFTDNLPVTFQDDGFLKFNSTDFITGINVLDGLLFWTDGINEPKKINIERMKSGCQTDLARFFDRTTALKINGSKKANVVTEKDITVIKKYPLNSPKLSLKESTRTGKITASLTTPSNTSWSSHGSVHARASGNLVIPNQTFSRPLAVQAEAGQRVLRFSQTPSSTQNIMDDGIHYKHWRSVTQSMSVEVNGSTIANGIKHVDYEDHCVHLNTSLTSYIPAGSVIGMRYWLNALNNESFWTYRTEDNKILPKPTGTNNLFQPDIVDGQTNTSGLIGRPIRIQELQFGGQPNFLAGDVIELTAPNPTAGANEDPDVKAKVKLLDEVVTNINLQSPAFQANAIANPGSALTSGTDITFAGSGNWKLFTRTIPNGLAATAEVALNTSDEYLEFNSDIIDTRSLFAVLPNTAITGGILSDSVYQVVVTFDMAGEYIEGSLRAAITTGGARNIANLTGTESYDINLETTAIVSGNPNSGATSITLDEANPGIVAGMKVRKASDDSVVANVSAISGTGLTLSSNSIDLADNDVLTFHAVASSHAQTFYLKTKPTFEENGVVINHHDFKAEVALVNTHWPNPFSSTHVNAIAFSPAVNVAGAPQSDATMRKMITRGMRVTGTNVPADTYVMSKRQGRVFFNNDVSGIAVGTTLNFFASFELKAISGFTNDNDIDLTVDLVNINKCVPVIGNGLGFQGTNTLGGFSRKVFNAEILSLSSNITQLNPTEPIDWSCGIEDVQTLFEDKFPRFAYRWMYADGEYSAISPFSKIVFLPNSVTGYEYDGQSGFNVSMQNNVRSIELTDFETLPLDVTEFQLLYKESNSTNIYHYLSKRGGELEFSTIPITSETINAVIPSNQLLRPYDNVPKSAKAQEISSNRLIYANYKQQYDIVGYNNDNAKFDYVFKTVANNVIENKPKPSMKAFRDYDLGVSLLDKYGRQTPVFSNDNRQIKLTNADAKQANLFEALVSSSPEEWTTHYKYFIHDKHNDHYNVALDRFYPAETREHVWLSFVSSDANKIQEDDFLILKKTHDSNEAVSENKKVKYKVLEKSSNAPESITGIKKLIGRIETGLFFGTSSSPSTNFPILGSNIVRLRGSSVIGSDLENIWELNQSNKYIRIGNSDQVVLSNYYKVSSVTRVDADTDGDFNGADDYYDIVLETNISGDTSFIGTSSSQTAGNFIEYYEKVVDNTASEFEGKFFVKILKDEHLDNYIISKGAPKDEIYYTLKYSKDIYWAHAWNQGTNNSGNYHSTGNTTVGDTQLDSNLWMLEQYSWSKTYEGGYSSVNYLGTGTLPNVAEYEFEFGNKPIYNTEEDLDLYGTIGHSSYTSDQKMCIDSAWSYGAAGIFNHLDDYGSGDHAKSGYGFRIGETRCQFRLSSVGSGTTGVNDIVVSNPSSTDISSELTSIYNDMKTAGTMFRWADDPDKTVYTIQTVESTHGVHQYRHSTRTNQTPLNSIAAAEAAPTDQANYAAVISAENNYNNSLVTNRTSVEVIAPDALILKKTYYITDGAFVYNQTRSAWVADSSGTKLTVQFEGAGSLPNHSPLKYAFPNYYLVFNGTASTSTRPNNNDVLYVTWSPTHVDGNGVLVDDNFDQTNSIAGDFLYIINMGWRYDLILNKKISWSPTSLLNGDGSNSASEIFPLTSTPSSHLASNSSKIEILKIDTDPIGDTFFSENPAVFEVEPQDAVDTNLYYETSNTDIVIKPGMYVSCNDVIDPSNPLLTYNPLAVDAVVDEVNYESNVLSNGPLNPGTPALNVKINGIDDTIPMGHEITIFSKDENDNIELIQTFTVLVGNSATQNDSVGNKCQLDYDPRAVNALVGVKIRPSKLEYFNCYSFGNGVESNRIRDDFNAITIDKGPRVSTTMLNKYMEEHKRHGFIYSGIYNNISTENNLNQFIQAEKITKELNPVYGSIQKLFSRNTNLLAFCENKVLKVLSNKDALFNADGNVNITSTNNVLGQAIPFAGEYGISTNPESFASYGYRVYFSDKDRNAVLRLSGDGVTDVSEKGMKDFFKDNLNEASSVVGSYDINKDLYNITLNNKTISFSENVGGFTSLKSFIPENGISISGDYYTFYNGEVWKHTVNTLRNNYYGTQYDSKIKFIFNDEPSVVKNFKTLNYEGTTSRSYNDDGVLKSSGWYSDSIETDLQSGEVKEFKNKEGKFFNYIKGTKLTTANLDSKEFSVQGLGVCSAISVSGTHTTKYEHKTRLIPSSEAISVVMVGGDYGYINSVPEPANFATSSASGHVNPATSGTTHTAAGFTINSTSQITGTIIANSVSYTDPNTSISSSIDSGVRFLRGVVKDLIPGQTYTVSATISGYTKGSGGIATDLHEVGFVDISGVGTTARRNTNGQISTTFVAIGKRLDIFKGAYVAAVMSNISIVKENTNLYPKFIINKSLTDLTTADTSITVNRSAGSISSESQIFYMHGQSVSGQRWNQIASGVTITEVSDPGTNIGTVTKLDGYIKSDGTFGAENTYQNTATNVIQLTVPVSGTMPSNNQTSILSAAVTSNLVQL